FSQKQFGLEVKNYQIHEMIRPLSTFYPAVCFVNAELCLDDGTVISAFAHGSRGATWNLPEKRSDFHWTRAARAHGVKIHDAYEDDDVRSDAEFGMLHEAVVHWDSRVRSPLAPPARAKRHR